MCHNNRISILCTEVNLPLTCVPKLGLCIVEDVFFRPAGGLVTTEYAAKLHGAEQVQFLQREDSVKTHCGQQEKESEFIRKYHI